MADVRNSDELHKMSREGEECKTEPLSSIGENGYD